MTWRMNATITRWLLGVTCATVLLVPDARAAVQDQPASRTNRNVEGWTVRVDDRLLRAPDDELGTRALRFLEAKLVEIKLVVPPERVKDLQRIPIVLDLKCG